MIEETTEAAAAEKQAVIGWNELSALALFASKDETRPYLQEVYLCQKAGAAFGYATDGHTMLILRVHPGDWDIPEGEVLAFRATEIVKRSTFPADCKLNVVLSDGRVSLATAHGSRVVVADVFEDDTALAFEDARKVIPHKAENEASLLCLNVRCLERFGKAFRLLFGRQWDGRIEIAASAPGGAAVIMASYFGIRALGLIMPMRGGDGAETADALMQAARRFFETGGNDADTNVD